MSKEKMKLIHYKMESEIEFKIQAAQDGLNLTKWLQKLLDDYADQLRKKRNLTI